MCFLETSCNFETHGFETTQQKLANSKTLHHVAHKKWQRNYNFTAKQAAKVYKTVIDCRQKTSTTNLMAFACKSLRHFAERVGVGCNFLLYLVQGN
jgi:hypothetical protein